MMKKTVVLFIMGFMLTIDLLSQSTPQNMTMDSPPAPGVYEATESITLQPGFSFTATQGNSLTLRIAPDAQSVQGAVVGYAVGQEWFKKHLQDPLTAFPSDAQLDRLTHVIASDIGCETDANNSYTGLWVGKLPNSWEGNISLQQTWNGTARNLWLQSLVSRAHAKGVHVSISVGGGGDKHFRTGTNSTNLHSFVNDIVIFVNLHGFDGVDIDWEWPGRYTYDANEWNQCYNLLNALKSALPGKRISIALAGYPNNSRYNNTTALYQIWNKVDAIYLMTYDNGDWDTHSDFDGTKNLIKGWADLATPSNNLDIKKLFLACAFYGYDTKDYRLWDDNRKVSYATYSASGFSGEIGDLPADVQAKANHSLAEGYGGVFIWELGYDANTSTTPTLLNAIGNALPIINGPAEVCYSGSTFTLTPAPSGAVTWSVTGPFHVSGNGATATVNLTGMSLFNGILTAKVNNTVVATKNISPCPPPTITGPAEVCYYGSNTFKLNNPPPGTITWEVSGPFNISSSSGNQVTLTKPNLSNAGGTLTAKVNGDPVATLSIESCQTEISGPSELTSGQIGEYEMPYIPNATYSWWNYYGTLILSSGGPGATGEAPYGLYGIDYEIIYCSVTLNGIVSYFSKYVTMYGGMSPFNAYPNPASNLLNIEIDANAVGTQRSAVGLQSDPTYDIRLYNGLGNIVRQQRTKSSTVQFNVTNLQEGTYYLHIYDGVSNKPKMMQIVVQH